MWSVRALNDDIEFTNVTPHASLLVEQHEQTDRRPPAQPSVRLLRRASATGPDRVGALTPTTGLRWVVLLWVASMHTGIGVIAGSVGREYTARSGGWTIAGTLLEWLGSIASLGFIATSAFLVLAGYALVVSNIDPGTSALRKTPTDFWRSRLLRFFPLLILTQLLRVPQLLLSSPHRSWQDLAGSISVNLVGLQAWFPSWVCDLNDPSWTLGVLSSCWAVFPWIGPRIARLSPRSALHLMLWILAYSLTIAFVFDQLHGPVDPTAHGPDFWRFFVHTNPLVRAPEVLSGMLLARVHRGYAPQIARLAPLLVTGGLLALVLACLGHNGVVPYVYLHNGLVLPIAWSIYLGLTEYGAAQGRANVSRGGVLSLADRFGRGLAGWLSRPAMQRAGRASFSFYLLHAVPIAGLIMARNATAGRPLTFRTGPLGPSPLVELALPVLYLLVAAAMSIRFHEQLLQPMTKRLDRWLPRRSPRLALEVVGAERRPSRTTGQVVAIA